MKKSIVLIFFLILLLILEITLISGCGDDKPPASGNNDDTSGETKAAEENAPLIGKWEYLALDILEFREDGTATWTMGSLVYELTYEDKGDKIVFRDKWADEAGNETLGDPREQKYFIKGQELHLEDGYDPDSMMVFKKK